jgi:F-box-like
MDLLPPLVIHKVLPSEILAVIFEEHAKLESRAPAIDGQVCRRWRQIILRTPRAWGYLDIFQDTQTRMEELRSWIDRSGAAPLHIRITYSTQFYTPISKQELYKQELYDLLSDYRARVISLQMLVMDLPYFEGREFPHLRVLDIMRSSKTPSHLPPIRWGPMPELQSLCLCSSNGSVTPLNSLVPLKQLILYNTICTSLLQHSSSLTTLMLDDVPFGDKLSSPVAFPSLTYLSLDDVLNLKRHIHTPCLVTYHETQSMTDESFLAPLPSLMEYGLYNIESGDPGPVEWHHSFPNLSRVSIRAKLHDLISVLHALCDHPDALPVLHTVCVGLFNGLDTIWEEDREDMETLVRARSEACDIDIALVVSRYSPFQIPIFFAEVSHHPSNDLIFLMQILGPRMSLVKVALSNPAHLLIQIQSAHTLRGWWGCDRARIYFMSLTTCYLEALYLYD